MKDKRLYTIAELSKKLDLSYKTIIKYVEAGTIPAIKHPVTNQWQFSKSAIDSAYKEYFKATKSQ